MYKRAASARRMDEIRKEDLMTIGLVGCGMFGPINLCRQRATGRTYVLRTMCKGLIEQANFQNRVIRQKSTWLQANCPFIIKVFAIYNEPRSVHFLVEAAHAG